MQQLTVAKHTLWSLVTVSGPSLKRPGFQWIRYAPWITSRTTSSTQGNNSSWATPIQAQIQVTQARPMQQLTVVKLTLWSLGTASGLSLKRLGFQWIRCGPWTTSRGTSSIQANNYGWVVLIAVRLRLKLIATPQAQGLTKLRVGIPCGRSQWNMGPLSNGCGHWIRSPGAWSTQDNTYAFNWSCNQNGDLLRWKKSISVSIDRGIVRL